ncbi:hypothetical protein [Pseudanabaena mucicola]|uniref:Uncharacterized protein n=1 Tax=Pseudanabaena mucicola FACHB-723 TaxID=2692860 RepID=A0ABR7ZY17_9CYAN|nr:hypothetical protein [Pseudanabaena mucicola]MBD2188146.1 hypothetical protein [Pseudanabaena mucicola FACHB-723]
MSSDRSIPTPKTRSPNPPQKRDRPATYKNAIAQSITQKRDRPNHSHSLSQLKASLS